MAVKKTDAAKVEKKVEEVKAAEKKAPAKAAAKKAPAKAAAKKPAAKKAPAKKAAAKKPAGDNVVLQYNGKDIEMKALVEACKADYKAKGHKSASNVCVYVKPEDNAAYYTVNGKGAEDFKVEL
ncbi:DUF6465 family protein [Ruminococcus sp. FC2018]|uniref:DUF6465 family protein n=1 Tax=Ruminococcus sp. FC2018 TaxID=1410617 RepID=UPI00049083B5|nr:DUF6465 family protein [Ruminococcus sp. FC2018]